MPRDPATPLDAAADDGEAGPAVQRRHQPVQFLGGKHLAIDAVGAAGIRGTSQDLELVDVVREVDLAALAEHHVEVQVTRQALVKLQRPVIEP